MCDFFNGAVSKMGRKRMINVPKKKHKTFETGTTVRVKKLKEVK